MKADPQIDPGDDRARFRSEVKRATRTTGISAGAVAAIGYPAWTLFDYLVEPSSAGDMLWLRLGLAVPVLLIWLGLVFAPQGRTHPELFLLALMGVIDLGIALMIAQVETHYASYALGMSLTIYAGAFLLIWSPVYMASVIGLNFGSLALVLLFSDPVPSDVLATIAFYVGTASLLGFLGQYHRQATAWSEFQARMALEREQERARALVDELDRLSREDSLTGLANRRAWDEALARECARAGRDEGELSVLLCDLDQ
ncbi:MAG TPA: GGDEF domain-containing protein, partial [Solirubrobacterales bacterium]|nr:GGDEF domain-containing protein [Solirubrobacterales bacterium]